MNPVSGLMDYRNRTYNPMIGRFGRRDPIGYAGGINVFSYVNGQPVTKKAPFGLSDALDFKGFPITPEEIAEILAKEKANIEANTAIGKPTCPEGWFIQTNHSWWNKRDEPKYYVLFSWPISEVRQIPSSFSAKGSIITKTGLIPVEISFKATEVVVITGTVELIQVVTPKYYKYRCCRCVYNETGSRLDDECTEWSRWYVKPDSEWMFKFGDGSKVTKKGVTYSFNGAAVEGFGFSK